MSETGVASIALGIVLVCSRGALLIAPEATLRWFAGVVATNGRTRAFGLGVLIFGAALAGAGASADTGLAMFLTVVGWTVVGVSAIGLVLFPGAYRGLYDRMTADAGDKRTGWRSLGFAGVVVGALLIYLGALDL